MTLETNVLVVGAGPTGLALALQAHNHGAHVRIVERRPDAFRPSRALIMHVRTLEVLRPLGVTDALLARANTSPEVCLHLGNRVVRSGLTDLALPDTAFPHLTLLRQMDVETVLTQALLERGIMVERGTDLIRVAEAADSVGATLRSQAGDETTSFTYVVGCDGPDSTVRRHATVQWEGGPYGEEVVLADVELDVELEKGIAHVFVTRQGVMLVFALGEHSTWRLLMTRPAGTDELPFGQPGPSIPPDELQSMLLESGLNVRITHLSWCARYRLQHRLASRFRQGRLFLAGDAAHAFSPAAGQGMNTGIQDATNLGWKLAFAAQASDPAILLDSYELERRPAVRRVLAMTHLVFWAEASTTPVPSLLRGVLGPIGSGMVPFFLNRRRLVAEVLRTVSQLRVSYRASPLSVEGAPQLSAGPRSGSRLPDAAVISDGRHVRLHDLLAQPGVHVLLHRDADTLEHLDFGRHVLVHRLTSTPGTGLVAVRPDGYIGFRCQRADVDQLRGWLRRIGAGSPQCDA